MLRLWTHSPLSMLPWWPRTRRGPSGSVCGSANERQGECCWSKPPWKCSCLWRGHGLGGGGGEWFGVKDGDDIRCVINIGSGCLKCFGFVLSSLPGSKRIRGRQLESVSWTIKIHYRQGDWRDVWASLSAQKETDEMKRRKYIFFFLANIFSHTHKNSLSMHRAGSAHL